MYSQLLENVWQWFKMNIESFLYMMDERTPVLNIFKGRRHHVIKTPSIPAIEPFRPAAFALAWPT